MTTCAVCELHAESTFKIEGMDCREEVAMLERRFKNLAGLEDFSADLMGQRLHVKYDAAKLSASAIADAVADTGMRAWLEHEEPIATTEGQARTRQILVAIAGAALGAGFVVEAFLSRAPSEGSWAEAGRYIPIALFGASLAAGVAVTTRKALSAMRVGALDINVLMLIAATGAIALGQWSEAATVVFLFAVAQALEARTLERAQAQRAPSQMLVERFARVYTPVVMALAALVAVGPPLVFHQDWRAWLYRALVLLVVSCPCALVISTPVSIVAALAGAARKGVLIKGGAHLERTSRVRCVAFDKTGTLTRGAPEVVDVVPLNGAGRSSVIGLAAAVEQRSEHPIAHAIVRHAESTRDVLAPATDVRSLAGRGAEGRVGGSRVLLGNHRLFEERRLCSPAIHDRLEELSASGQTAVLVAHDDQPIGIIAVSDRPRKSGKDTVDLLRQHGITSVVMLTGDNRSTASAIAAELGVDDVRAELLPEDKVTAVDELRRRYGCVAMVGDGVNDAPALTSADVGIAMGAAGSDAALETADVALMADELLKIPYTFRLSRATVRNIKMNLAISIVVKAAFVVAAVAGVATLWMAIVADTGASVIVIANALRLLRAD